MPLPLASPSPLMGEGRGEGDDRMSSSKQPPLPALPRGGGRDSLNATRTSASIELLFPSKHGVRVVAVDPALGAQGPGLRQPHRDLAERPPKAPAGLEQSQGLRGEALEACRPGLPAALVTSEGGGDR